MIYQHGSTLEAPFTAAPMQLETNLRNPQPIGEFAAHIAHYPPPAAFRVQSGTRPITLRSADFNVMAGQLRTLLNELTQKENIAPEQIVLSPYRMENAKSAWRTGFVSSQNIFRYGPPSTGNIRVGTIQGFKGWKPM